MKMKALFVAFAALFLFSCAREIVPENKDNNSTAAQSYAFTASIDGFATKAVIHDDGENEYSLYWAENDMIGIYTSDNKARNPFKLDGLGGAPYGTFEYCGDGTFDRTDANGAYFPWQANPGEGRNNIWEGVFYINLPESYGNADDVFSAKYKSGQMFTPLAAVVNYNSDAGKYDSFTFSHVAAAVQVTIEDLPTYAHSIGMKVDGKQITGGFQITLANVGAEGTAGNMLLSASENTENNTVWLNFENNAVRDFVFIFPVPALTNPKLSFYIYDKNNVKIWSKNLKAQTVSLNHGDILVMPPTPITYYQNLNAISSEWSVVGTEGGWENDIPMVTDGEMCVAKGLTFSAGAEFKVRKDGAWSVSYGEVGGGNKVVSDAGTYDVIFKIADGTVVYVPTDGCPYPSANGYGKGSDLADPTDLTGTWATYYE